MRLHLHTKIALILFALIAGGVGSAMATNIPRTVRATAVVPDGVLVRPAGPELLASGHILLSCTTVVRIVVRKNDLADTLVGLAVVPCPSWSTPDSIVQSLSRWAP